MRRLIGAAMALGLAGAILANAGSAKAAELKVGVIIPQTGAAANLGASVYKALQLWPTEIDGTPLKVIIRDDRSDVTTSTTMARQLISDEKVDVLVGIFLTPHAVAIAPIAEEQKVPFYSSVPVPNAASPGKWLFDLGSPVSMQAKAVIGAMKKNGVKTVGMIGYSDSWGDQWKSQLVEQGGPLGLELVADERYARADTSVAGQALKLMSLNPSAVLVAASFAGAAVPVVELRNRGYTGKIFHSGGMDRVSYDKAAGDAGNGAIFPASPVDLASDMPDSNPIKQIALGVRQKYEAVNGANSMPLTAAVAFDVVEILKGVVPIAKKKGAVGTPEFRQALRDATENSRTVGSNGIYEFTPENHHGLSNGTGSVMGIIENHQWKLLAE